jgi:uncharacterized protein YecE (DUF72 family)
LEINGSFYSLQHPTHWARWYAETPDSFVFGIKGPRFITHMLKLRDAQQPLANFFASGVLALGEKLGPILWQLPAAVRFDPARIEPFLALLPRDMRSALRLARRRHPRMYGRSRLAIDAQRTLRHALEIRHESFLDPRFTALLRAYGVALVVAETARKWPMPLDVTADFVYLRLHGDREIYRSGYGPVALSRWAGRIEAWHAGGEPDDLPRESVRIDARRPERSSRDVYCYFDNTDAKLRAPFDARRLARLVASGGAQSSRNVTRPVATS